MGDAQLQRGVEHVFTAEDREANSSTSSCSVSGWPMSLQRTTIRVLLSCFEQGPQERGAYRLRVSRRPT
jgi:hypothetical protein